MVAILEAFFHHRPVQYVGNWPGNIVIAVQLIDSTLLELLDKLIWFYRQRKHRSAEW